MSKPQKYPGASTAYWYQKSYPGSRMNVNAAVWHSTEGLSRPGYSGGSMAPTFTAVPDFGAMRLRWYQHFDVDVSARALANRAGGVETNTLNVVQIELVGTCDARHAKTWTVGGRTYRAGVDYLYTGSLPSWVVRDLAAFCRWLHDHHGVPLTSGLSWKPYPSSYGTNGVRMSAGAWNNFRGHCGHMHVPENDHGDPGAFPMGAILAAARTAAPPSPKEELDMNREQVYDAVWNPDVAEPPKTSTTKKTNPKWAPIGFLRAIFDAISGTRSDVKRLEKKIDALTEKLG